MAKNHIVFAGVLPVTLLLWNVRTTIRTGITSLIAPSWLNGKMRIQKKMCDAFWRIHWTV